MFFKKCYTIFVNETITFKGKHNMIYALCLEVFNMLTNSQKKLECQGFMEDIEDILTERNNGEPIFFSDMYRTKYLVYTTSSIDNCYDYAYQTIKELHTRIMGEH